MPLHLMPLVAVRLQWGQRIFSVLADRLADLSVVWVIALGIKNLSLHILGRSRMIRQYFS